MHLQEIELKLRLSDPEALTQKLIELRAQTRGTRTQVDILYESPVVNFKERDQALRLRSETINGHTTSILTFKGTPHFTPEGHKVRDEFETPVENGDTMRRIIEALGFREGAVLEKTRESYTLDTVSVEIDRLRFGTFVELEGTSDAIERVRKTLGLADTEPRTQNYVALQHAWDAEHAS